MLFHRNAVQLQGTPAVRSNIQIALARLQMPRKLPGLRALHWAAVSHCVMPAYTRGIRFSTWALARVFAEVFRVLKPGGRFSISDMVSRGQIPVSVRKNPELWAGCIGGAIDEEEYLDVIRETGFRDVEVHDRYESASVKKDGYSLVSVTVEAVKPKVL